MVRSLSEQDSWVSEQISIKAGRSCISNGKSKLVFVFEKQLTK